MLAPCQMNMRAVRLPNTTSKSSAKASSLKIPGQKGAVWLGDDDVVADRLPQAALDRNAVALPRLQDLARAGARDLFRGYQGAALLLTTRTSSTTPVSKKSWTD